MRPDTPAVQTVSAADGTIKRKKKNNPQKAKK